MVLFSLGSDDSTYAMLENYISDVSSGDKKALEKLFTLTKSSVYGFALSISKNPENAEDIMQDTYIKLFYNAHTYIPQGKPLAWILTITRNLALMNIRKNSKFDDIEKLAEPKTEDFSDDSIDKIILNTALDILSEEEREIIVLYSVSGLKHKEIAQLLALPLSTVLSKYHRSLKKLKKYLKEEVQYEKNK